MVGKPQRRSSRAIDIFPERKKKAARGIATLSASRGGKLILKSGLF
jgi:hypothetical protein